MCPNDPANRSGNAVYICVDHKNPIEFSGAIYQKNRRLGLPCQSVGQLIQNMDLMFDAIGYPAASVKYRTFGKQNANANQEGAKDMAESTHIEFTEEMLSGKHATFIVQIQYRQNATWQGQIVWAEKNETKYFRSALELIKLIDSALEETPEQQ